MMQSYNKSDLMDVAMASIYGAGATQTLGGGACKKKRKVKGGAPSKVEDVGMIEYAEHPEFRRFVSAFYLSTKINLGYSSAVYLVPSEKTLDKMIADFKALLKEKDLVDKTLEAKRFCISQPLPYKRYIFTTYPVGSTDTYSLDAINPMKNFGVAKRVNSLQEVYWFKYVDDTTIEIHNQPPTAKSEHTTVKLIIRAELGTFVFQGELPEAKEYFNKPIVKKLSGGNKPQTMFEYINNGVTSQEGALNYIASVACSTPKNKALCQKAIGGDLINSAFRVAFACNRNAMTGGRIGDEEDDENKYTEEDIESMGTDLIKGQEFTTKTYDKATYAKNFKNIYMNVAMKNLSPSESSRLYKAQLINMYNNLGTDVLKADIATALHRNGYSLENAYSLADSVDNDSDNEFTDVSKLEFIKDKVCYTSQYNSIINKALLSAPLISVNSKTYAPSIMLDARKKKVTKRKTTKKSTKRKAQEEVEQEETPVIPAVEEEEVKPVESKKEEVTKPVEEPKEEIQPVEEEEEDDEEFADAY